MVVDVNRWEGRIWLFYFTLLTLTTIVKHCIRWDVRSGPMLNLIAISDAQTSVRFPPTIIHAQ